ncbi:hypothetical protein TrLO_g8858 [Triparma laevis f. longispina]|uniref:Adenylate kinase n=1 Tax=Triparma laevis f. longispina TaxID=1714387 RepID=A0A9W7E549_9STRA|nr:hypothetical protein TrLO_g8858 [Triparma laevis f. longispina]
MLRAAVKAGSEVGKKAKKEIEEGELVSDELIIGVVKERLAQKDCRERGWLLDGFPRTRAQADALSAAGITCDIFIFLKVPDEILVERVAGRRTDPETGKIYHLKFSPPPPSISERLTHRADDTEEKVKIRLKAFHENVNSIASCYTEVMFEVKGDQDKKLVEKTIVDHLDKLFGEQGETGLLALFSCCFGKKQKPQYPKVDYPKVDYHEVDYGFDGTGWTDVELNSEVPSDVRTLDDVAAWVRQRVPNSFGFTAHPDFAERNSKCRFATAFIGEEGDHSAYSASWSLYLYSIESGEVELENV